MVLYCATRGQLLRAVPLALGSINMVGIRPHDIFANALDLPVDSIVMCHNHPSGDAQPSPADIVFTRRIQAACSLMGYWLRDHIIMARREYYSFREQHTLDMTGD
jgi:DNA repair protein RadC